MRDAALVLGAIATDTNKNACDYVIGLHADALSGARLGVARNYTDIHHRVDVVFEESLRELSLAGATVVDGLDAPHGEQLRDDERLVLETEFHVGLNEYLSARTGDLKVRNLAELVAFNLEHQDEVLQHFGQEGLLASVQRSGLADAAYQQALTRSRHATQLDGIDRLLAEHQLDAIIAPTHTVPWLIDWLGGDNRRPSFAMPAAIAGYPHVTVPMGMVDHLPVGLSFVAGAHSDQHVINLAYAYEQRNPERVPDLSH